MVLDRIYPCVPPPPHREEQRERGMIRELLLTVIQDNIFTFNNNSYRQVKGMAMGTRMAPPFANLFMASLEEKALTTWMVCSPPTIWARYLDDVFLVWEDTETNLQLFLDHLNSMISTITLTVESSYQQVDFMDLTIYKGPRFAEKGILDVRPFSKKMAAFAYLHFRSCHSPQVFKNVVRGEALIALRNSSGQDVFAKEMEKLVVRFSNRGYPVPFILTTIEDVRFSTRTTHLEKKSEQRTLDESTTILSVRQHSAISSADVSEVLRDLDLPFVPMVARKRADAWETCWSPRPPVPP